MVEVKGNHDSTDEEFGEYEVTFSRTNSPEVRQHIIVHNIRTGHIVRISLNAEEMRRFQEMWGVK